MYQKNNKRIKYLVIIGVFLILVLVLPNIINFKERKAFSDDYRLEYAEEHYATNQLGDSVTIIPGKYYDRGKLFTLFLGEKNRDLWATPVKVKVMRYNKAKGGIKPVDIGGSQQTIGIDLTDSLGREWSLRSVNKDQSKALPLFLRPTFLRFMFRDQVAAMNPYAALVVPVLAEKVGILHTNPQLVFVPYDPSQGKFNERMAGRMAILEEDLDNTWKGSTEFGNPITIKDTENMFLMASENNIAIDTLQYAKSRLLDILISDWDRHEGQWEWLLVEENEKKLFKPVPVDRDIAFYHFDEGLLSHVALQINNKFQSFHEDFGQVSGLMHQSKNLDNRILKNMPAKEWKDLAEWFQDELTDEIIHEAFKKYPPEIYQKVGKEHETILKTRLQKLPEVAAQLPELLD